jgi:hypothetical protein
MGASSAVLRLSLRFVKSSYLGAGAPAPRSAARVHGRSGQARPVLPGLGQEALAVARRDAPPDVVRG